MKRPLDWRDNSPASLPVPTSCILHPANAILYLYQESSNIKYKKREVESMSNNRRITHRKALYAFTIVELLVVIVVIGILASITIVSYRGITQKATAATIQADLANAAKQLQIYKATNDSYPTAINCTNPSATELCIKASNGNTLVYKFDNSSSPAIFGLTEKNSSGISYYVTESTGPVIGVFHTGLLTALATAEFKTFKILQQSNRKSC